MSLKTGKKPFAPDDRDIKLRAVAPTVDKLAPPPPRFGWGLAFPDWLMLGNGPDPSAPEGARDGVGNCIPAGLAHGTRLWNHTVGQEVAFDGTCVISDYSAATGYVVGDPNTDNGTDVRQYLLYAQRTGILDSAGNRHKIGAFVAVSPGDLIELLTAAFWFENVFVGIQFPESAMEQFNQGEIWDVVPGAKDDGGHLIVATGRKAENDNGVITWGRRQGMTDRFYETYCDEAWAAVSEEELRAGVSRRGLDLSTLNRELQNLGISQ